MIFYKKKWAPGAITLFGALGGPTRRIGAPSSAPAGLIRAPGRARTKREGEGRERGDRGKRGYRPKKQKEKKEKREKKRKSGDSLVGPGSPSGARARGARASERASKREERGDPSNGGKGACYMQATPFG